MNIPILKTLTCPICATVAGNGQDAKGELVINKGPEPSLQCVQCGKVYRFLDGLIDFVGYETGYSKTLVQHAMEFRPLIYLYEHVWRPTVTRPFSSLKWEMETSMRLLELKAGQDVLDIACGPGNFTRRISSTIHSGTVTGIDLSMPMLEKAARMPEPVNGPAITFLRVDVTKWVFKLHTFDRIHCAGALHLFPDLQNIFKSIARSLKPGGIFVGATYIKGGGALKRKFQDHFAKRSGFHWFEPEELRELCDNAGLIGWEAHRLKQGLIFKVTAPYFSGIEGCSIP